MLVANGQIEGTVRTDGRLTRERLLTGKLTLGTMPWLPEMCPLQTSVISTDGTQNPATFNDPADIVRSEFFGYTVDHIAFDY